MTSEVLSVKEVEVLGMSNDEEEESRVETMLEDNGEWEVAGKQKKPQQQQQNNSQTPKTNKPRKRLNSRSSKTKQGSVKQAQSSPESGKETKSVEANERKSNSESETSAVNNQPAANHNPWAKVPNVTPVSIQDSTEDTSNIKASPYTLVKPTEQVTQQASTNLDSSDWPSLCNEEKVRQL